MLAILLRFLSVLGIVLLCLLGLLVLAVVLVLFFPVSYRLYGRRDAGTGDIKAWAKFRWLFGLFRADYQYPKPGKMTAKFLGITIYDSGSPPKDNPKSKREKVHTRTSSSEKAGKGTLEVKEKTDSMQSEAAAENRNKTESFIKTGTESEDTPPVTDGPGGTAADRDAGSKPHQTWLDRLLERFSSCYEKIKDTIQKICDKIMDIWKHFEYYKDLFQDEETHLLFGDVRLRIQKVLKGIHPRKVRADIHFGTGSPDTTGYALGIYGMLSSVLGKNINVTPNFEEAVLEGEVYLAGHVTMFLLLMNVGKLFFDRRLRQFIKQLKMEDT